jgi:hypothetical protein
VARGHWSPTGHLHKPAGLDTSRPRGRLTEGGPLRRLLTRLVGPPHTGVLSPPRRVRRGASLESQGLRLLGGRAYRSLHLRPSTAPIQSNGLGGKADVPPRHQPPVATPVHHPPDPPDCEHLISPPQGLAGWWVCNLDFESAIRRSWKRRFERAAFSCSSRVRLSLVSWRTRCLRVVSSVVMRWMASRSRISRLGR